MNPKYRMIKIALEAGVENIVQKLQMAKMNGRRDILRLKMEGGGHGDSQGIGDQLRRLAKFHRKEHMNEIRVLDAVIDLDDIAASESKALFTD